MFNVRWASLQIQSQVLLPLVFLTVTKPQPLDGAVDQHLKFAGETTELHAVGMWSQTIQAELLCVCQNLPLIFVFTFATNKWSSFVGKPMAIINQKPF